MELESAEEEDVVEEADKVALKAVESEAVGLEAVEVDESVEGAAF